MPWYDASFGSSKTGLATVGYREVDNTGTTTVARTTTGVVEIGGGGYGVDVTLNAATVVLEWDTGEATPIYAHDNLEIKNDEVQSDLAAINTILVTSGVTLDAATLIDIADAILNRDFALVPDTNARTALNALRFLRNRWSIAGTTLTVTEEDDATPAWTSDLTPSPGAAPISGSDPV